MGGRWSEYVQSEKASTFIFNPDSGREGFNCDFWEYKETGVPLDGRRDRKRPWLLTILESLTCYDPEGG